MSRVQFEKWGFTAVFQHMACLFMATITSGKILGFSQAMLLPCLISSRTLLCKSWKTVLTGVHNGGKLDRNFAKERKKRSPYRLLCVTVTSTCTQLHLYRNNSRVFIVISLGHSLTGILSFSKLGQKNISVHVDVVNVLRYNFLFLNLSSFYSLFFKKICISDCLTWTGEERNGNRREKTTGW